MDEIAFQRKVHHQLVDELVRAVLAFRVVVDGKVGGGLRVIRYEHARGHLFVELLLGELEHVVELVLLLVRMVLGCRLPRLR